MRIGTEVSKFIFTWSTFISSPRSFSFIHYFKYMFFYLIWVYGAFIRENMYFFYDDGAENAIKVFRQNKTEDDWNFKK